MQAAAGSTPWQQQAEAGGLVGRAAMAVAGCFVGSSRRQMKNFDWQELAVQAQEGPDAELDLAAACAWPRWGLHHNGQPIIGCAVAQCITVGP